METTSGEITQLDNTGKQDRSRTNAFQFGPQTSQCFVENKNRYKGVFKAADLELKNSFFKFRSYNTFFGQIWFQNFKMLCFE